MPHCIIEFSENLTDSVSPDEMVKTVYQAALDTDLFDPATVKSRAISYQHILGNAERFVHVTAKILSGRTTEQKIALSNLIMERLQGLPFPAVELSVDIVDMEKTTYSKGKAHQ